MNGPEKKSPTETLDLQQKIADTMAGKRPKDDKYPYFSPDYELPFTHIGTEKQLFVDNYILDHLEDVERVFPAPQRPDKPVLKGGELPWEMNACNNIIPIAAVYDEADGKYKMWYSLSISGDSLGTGQVICYAESDDCLNWTKPLSEHGLPIENYTSTNIVFGDSAGVTVVRNHDQSDPQRKYLMLYDPYTLAKQIGRFTLSYVAASPDGIRWTVISEDSPLPHQHEPRIIWDESIQRWVAYSQYSHHWHHGPRIRQIGRQESEDFIHWSPKEVVISPEWDPMLPPELELGWASVRKIGGLYIGIIDEYHTEPMWCVSPAGTNWRDQTVIKMALYSSRDGRRWQRVVRDTWVDNRAPGSMDARICGFSAADYLVHNGRMFIPYCAVPGKQWAVWSPAGKVVAPESARDASIAHHQFMTANCADPLSYMPRRAVGMLILREDGWAMLKPKYEQGKAYTKQFVFEGNSLKVNADCKYGCVKVEILDPHFKPYEGFSADDCDPVHDRETDKVWHTVTWKGKSDVSSLWNKPVRIAFHLHEASVYAFQFVNS